MKKWEDIFKDKLGGMEIDLSEGSLDEFRTRLDRAGNTTPMNRFTFGWVMAALVAAGLAVILFLRQPTVPENGIHIIQQPEPPVSVVSDSTHIQTLITQTSILNPIVHPTAFSQEPRIEKNPVETKENVPYRPTEDICSDGQETSTPDTQDVKTIDNPVEATTSSFTLNKYDTKNVSLKVGPAVGIIAGGSILAAVITSTIGPSRSIPAPINGGQMIPDGSALQNDYTHSFPLVLGISTKIPITNRLFITSGFDYSVYTSKFAYSISGEKKQIVHYLGIPVCLDFSIASTRWLDVYVGGGLRGDYCINASLDETTIEKDGLSLSILGSGGIQFNVIPQLGIYVEPEISYLIPYQSYRLETYRTDSPLVFSVKSGLRINISNKALIR